MATKPRYYVEVNQLTQKFKVEKWTSFAPVSYTNEQRDKILNAININKVSQVYNTRSGVLLQLCLDENFDLFILK